jgi:hypothetical protein
MKAIVAYSSRTGDTERLARAAREVLGAAASITRETDAVAVGVSESALVRVFNHGGFGGRNSPGNLALQSAEHYNSGSP